MFKYIISVLFLIPNLLYSQALFTFQSENMNIKLVKLSSNLGTPWGMTFISLDEMLITKKSGEVLILNINTKEIKNINNPPIILYDGQGGLLDIQSSPFFKDNSILYLTYVKKIKGKGVTTLAKAKLKNNSFVDFEDLLVTKSSTNTSRHFGSRITFDKKGHLFFSVGDRGVRKNAQNLNTHAGSILRLNLDGTTPKDNPFINEKNKLKEIYSFGHRNPQGLFYDKKTDRLWSIEHGPRGGDEINLIRKGLNYGWPVISYGKEYWSPFRVGDGTHKEGMIQPKKVYIPSIAPSSLIVYNGDVFPKWKGNIFSGALKLTHLNRVVIDKKGNEIKEERLLKNLGERIRNIIQSPRGNLIISTDSGNLYKLIPSEIN